MAHRYAPLPNPTHNRNFSQHDRVVEMEAAFDYSDDEDRDDHNVSESQPLNGRAAGVAPILAQPRPPSPFQHSPAGPGAYNFENVDYDFPPPGSPPPPSATALPNTFGNSNGMVPDFSAEPAAARASGTWIRRAVASVLPASVLSKFGLVQQRPSGPVGGGINNDGVFANVMAKPTVPVQHQEGDEFVAPEDAQREAPPSYASAQADAVPPYWETTIHAPFASDSVGEMIVDNLPTGSLFSFCWNLLVSVAFQFVGFLLTYLLHTSHAARLGSRAGLGITLIQYGFALRGKYEAEQNGNGGRPEWSWTGSPSNSSGGADGGDNSGFRPHHHHHHNPDGSMANVTWSTPMSNLTEAQASMMIADATTEWLSFFLMTIGWFVLLTSLLGFWRVKRWERSVIASRNTSSGNSDTTSGVPQSGRRPAPLGLASQLDSHFGLRGTSRIELLRQGFGFGSTRRQHEGDDDDVVVRAEDGVSGTGTGERDPMILTAPHVEIPGNVPPERAVAIARMLENEVRLQRDLREAGLL